MNLEFRDFLCDFSWNFVICVLYKSGYGLYYYKNPKSTVEMDFFVRDADSLVPAEAIHARSQDGF